MPSDPTAVAPFTTVTEGETRVRTLRAPFFRPDHPFWVMVGVRSLFLVLTAFTLVWAPYARTSTGAFFNGATQNPPAYNGLTDLIFNTFGTWDSGHFSTSPSTGTTLRGTRRSILSIRSSSQGRTTRSARTSLLAS